MVAFLLQDKGPQIIFKNVSLHMVNKKGINQMQHYSTNEKFTKLCLYGNSTDEKFTKLCLYGNSTDEKFTKLCLYGKKVLYLATHDLPVSFKPVIHVER